LPVPLYKKYPRLADEYYRGGRVTFVTICCAERRAIFSDTDIGRWAQSQLVSTGAQHAFALHAYCFMPDHLHVVAAGMNDNCDLVKFVNAFKQRIGYEYKKRYRRQLWQTRFYDHILRSADGIQNVACYVWMNPVRKGLCAEPSQYPLSGSQTMEWMNARASDAIWLPPWKKTATPG
jgi:putative transposase